MTEEPAPLHIPQEPVMLSETETFDVLFWSFRYSQGSLDLQRQILSFIRRTHEVPDSVKALYTRNKKARLDEHIGNPYFYDIFDLPDDELPRYREFLSGAHIKNTGGVPEDNVIKRQIRPVVGELMDPIDYNYLTDTELLGEIFKGMLAKDFEHVVTRARRDSSQVFEYIYGMSTPPGGPIFSKLMRALRPVADHMLADAGETEIEVLKRNKEGDAVYSPMPLKEVFGTTRSTLETLGKLT